jgi:hypothetical protein
MLCRLYLVNLAKCVDININSDIYFHGTTQESGSRSHPRRLLCSIGQDRFFALCRVLALASSGIAAAGQAGSRRQRCSSQHTSHRVRNLLQRDHWPGRELQSIRHRCDAMPRTSTRRAARSRRMETHADESTNVQVNEAIDVHGCSPADVVEAGTATLSRTPHRLHPQVIPGSPFASA